MYDIKAGFVSEAIDVITAVQSTILIEVTDDVFLISKEAAEAYVARQATGEAESPTGRSPGVAPQPGEEPSAGGVSDGATASPRVVGSSDVVPGFRWTGEIAPQKWMNFYTKVLARFATTRGLKLVLAVEVQPDDGVSRAKIEEMKIALRELGMPEDVDIRGGQ